jgi:hypothetical protein
MNIFQRFFRVREARFQDSLCDDLHVDTKSSDWHKRLKIHEERTFIENQSMVVKRPIGNAKRGD